MTLRIERYGNTRHWAVYDAHELVVVTVYRRGALEVLRRLQAQAPGDPAANAAAAAARPAVTPPGAATAARWRGGPACTAGEPPRDQRERYGAARGQRPGLAGAPAPFAGQAAATDQRPDGRCQGWRAWFVRATRRAWP
jgi:hypothetical protein